MPTYTVVVTGLNGHQHVTALEFSSDQAIIADTREAIAEEHPSIAIGRGSGDAVEFIGAWDRGDDGQPHSTPQE